MATVKPGMGSGVLYPEQGGRHFVHARFTPQVSLSPFVQHFWTVAWDLPATHIHVQETIPYPCVHLAIERQNSEIVCVLRGRFRRKLQGSGRVFAVRFRPGGFYPFLRQPMHQLLEQRLSLAQLWPQLDIPEFEERLLTLNSELAMANTLEQLLLDNLPPLDQRMQLLQDIYAYIEDNKDVHSVAQLAAYSGLSVRAIQRLFACYVGVPPKWVIQRLRLHNAMQRVTDDPGINFAALAHDLGYADQAHFTRDFKAVVGVSPHAYRSSL